MDNFSTDTEAAYYFGQTQRMRDIEPKDAPLSGEWADDLTPASVVEFVTTNGFSAPIDELEYGEWVQELCEAFEEGYYA